MARATSRSEVIDWQVSATVNNITKTYTAADTLPGILTRLVNYLNAQNQ